MYVSTEGTCFRAILPDNHPLRLMRKTIDGKIPEMGASYTGSVKNACASFMRVRYYLAAQAGGAPRKERVNLSTV